jgi:hypothetical protein
VDSLAAIEVRNAIFRRFHADVSVFDILSDLSLAKLVEVIVKKSGLVRQEIIHAAQDA